MPQVSSIQNYFKNGFITGTGLGIGFLSTSLFAAAAAMNIFSPGQSIDSSLINQNFRIVAPEGAVVSFYLSSCPEGWAPADGSNGTPDLRGRFVRGLNDFGTGSSGVDPDNARTTGSLQADAFQGHTHNMPLGEISNYPTVPYTPYQTINTWEGRPRSFLLGSELTPGMSGPADSGQGEPRVSTETRPVNVGLIFCKRKI